MEFATTPFFLRTLEVMPTETDNVIAFPGVSVAAEPATLIVGASLTEDVISVHRTIGINDQLTMAELAEVLRIVFGWSGSEPMKFTIASASFDEPETVLSMGTRVCEVLTAPGDRLEWQWGLWLHELQVCEAFARDNATPDALCIGGSGTIAALGDNEAPAFVDIAAINAELTGQKSIQATLNSVRSDIAEFIDRSGVFEFVPLLQALDLTRVPDTSLVANGTGGAGGTSFAQRRLLQQLRSLPLEQASVDPAGHDAALANLLCLAALADDDVRHDVTVNVMDELGWVNDDGSPLSGTDIEQLCPATWKIVVDLGLAGENLAPPVQRLEMLREVCRK